MQESFHHTFEAPIWKLLFDIPNNILGVEVRALTEQKVTFLTLDLHTFPTIKPNKAWEENAWWIGVGALVQNKLLLYQYAPTQQKPIQQGFKLVDIATKSTIWEHKNFHFYTLWQETVIAYTYKDEWPIHVGIDLHTGKIMGEIEEQQLASLLLKTSLENLHKPQIYPANHAYFATVSQFLQNILGLDVNLSQPIHYLEYKNYIFVGYISPKNEELLLILDKKGNLLQKYTLNAIAKGGSQDSFIIFKDYLVFIQNMDRLNIIKI